MQEAEPIYLFYRAANANSRTRTLAPGYSGEFWRPSPARAIPAGLPATERNRFRMRWLLHCLRAFPNRDYSVFVVRRGNEFVHYSGITGRYWRFPFLADADLQIGDTWTHPEHRGKGIAGFAIDRILAAMSRPGRHIWYVVENINTPSIRAAEGAGMTRFALGVWRRPFGLKLFGSYVIRDAVGDVHGEGHPAVELDGLHPRPAGNAPVRDRTPKAASTITRRV